MKACRRLHPHNTSNTFFLFVLFLLREKLDCKLLSVVDMCMDFWTVFWNASRVDCTKCVTTAPWNETWPHKQHFCVTGKPDDDKICPKLYCHSIKLCFNQREVSSTPRTSVNQPRSRPWQLFRKGWARWTKFWAGDWMRHLSISALTYEAAGFSRYLVMLWSCESSYLSRGESLSIQTQIFISSLPLLQLLLVFNHVSSWLIFKKVL